MPEHIRELNLKSSGSDDAGIATPSFTWVIEISSQILFSTSAAVNFELLVGRDEKSVDLGFAGFGGTNTAAPGQLQDHQQGKGSKTGHSAAQSKGVYSKAISLAVDDTASLWNKPVLPEWDDQGGHRGLKHEFPDRKEHGRDFKFPERHEPEDQESAPPREKKRKKIHLVVLTHGLHGNLGADLLYLKESIDATAKESRLEAKLDRAKSHGSGKGKVSKPLQHSSVFHTESDERGSNTPILGDQHNSPVENTEDSDEEVIVRGFSGNAVRTEKGIQYLGKRLAKYVLSMTYPDQPFLPIKKSVGKKISSAFSGQEPSDTHGGLPAHQGSSIRKELQKPSSLAYQITSISFIGHSLGGLTQTYAIAYIHKHSPHFFEQIKPINFIAMATPFLGLSNENPIYVKFALDFGLVGRTGQDLGLTWRAPYMVRSGWGAMIGGIGSEGQRAHRQRDPGSKPLLRILPSGPAHQVLKLFRNRTVYSNVVNDGIVPLRTSCLLFLDWRGLGRVEKARRDNGLVGTMAQWGWAEFTGANASSHKRHQMGLDGESSSQGDESDNDTAGSSRQHLIQDAVPQPSEDATKDDNITEGTKDTLDATSPNGQVQMLQEEEHDSKKSQENSPAQPTHPLGGLLAFLSPSSAKKPQPQSPKHSKIYRRSQTRKGELEDDDPTVVVGAEQQRDIGQAIGHDPGENGQNDEYAPPKTSFFESAGDVLKPPLPSEDFLVDPKSRPRTIFHDRIYHPEDIPPPPRPRPRSIRRLSFGSDSKSTISRASTDYEHHSMEQPDTSGMKVEEKIARAYHRDLSWRKVLVRLEPDAHNNMIVRRMFANAYGWPVIKHLCETHFANTFSATTADEVESSSERARPMAEGVDEDGNELKDGSQDHLRRTNSELREAKDEVHDITSPEGTSLHSSITRSHHERQDSASWDDKYFEVTDDDDDDDIIAEPAPSNSKRRNTMDDNEVEARLSALSEYQGNRPRSQGNLESPLTMRAKPLVAPVLSMSPTMKTPSTTVGLQESLEEQLASAGQAQ